MEKWEILSSYHFHLLLSPSGKLCTYILDHLFLILLSHGYYILYYILVDFFTSVFCFTSFSFICNQLFNFDLIHF